MTTDASPDSENAPFYAGDETPGFKVIFGSVVSAFGLVWRAHPPSAVLMIILTVAAALVPAGLAWVGKLLVDEVAIALRDHLDPQTAFHNALRPLIAGGALTLLQGALAQARYFTEEILHQRLSLSVSMRIAQKAQELDLTQLENAAYYDMLQNAVGEADWRGLQIVKGTFDGGQTMLTLISFAAILTSVSPLLSLVLLFAALPAFFVRSRFAVLTFRAVSYRAPEVRLIRYYLNLMTEYQTVREVKLFGLGPFLLNRFRTLFEKFYTQDVGIAQRRSLASVFFGSLGTLCYYGCIAWVVKRAADGQVSIGELTMYISVLYSTQSTGEEFFKNTGELYEHCLFMSNLSTFFALTPQLAAPVQPKALPPRLTTGIEFRNVSFRYPNEGGWALKNVNLTLHPGKKVALVGLNGAGKTTLIKLLTRLYDPTEGSITFDGIDLRECDPVQLRQKISVLMQDFVRFQLKASENIGFGDLPHFEDLPRIETAARKSEALELIRKLPEGMNTPLGQYFEGGHELSGGEWQRVALGRAFMRECDLIILDEPTAALDADNELKVFQQVRDNTEGKAALLISHRFSTVRMADRILVLEAGTITEEGSHQELLALGKTYARLFTLQAESYK